MSDKYSHCSRWLVYSLFFSSLIAYMSAVILCSDIVEM